MEDYGQCSACPRTCRSCNGQRVSSSLIPPHTHVLSIETASDGTQRLLLDGLDDLSAKEADEALGGERVDERLDNTPLLLRITPLLLLASCGGLSAAYLDFHGSAERRPLVAHLVGATAVMYMLVLLVLMMMYVPRHPDMCTVSLRRIVPLTPQTVSMGEVVSFYPRGSGGNHLYAVLIRARFVDALRETCLLVSFGMPLLSMVVLIHISWWHRITLHIRSAARVYRLVDRIINTMLVATFGEMKEREREQLGQTFSRTPQTSPPLAQGSATSNSEAESSSAPAAVVEEKAASQPHNGRASAGDQSANGGDAGLGVGSFVGGSECVDCPICMEEYVDEDEVVLLPCRHLLHKECLLSWAHACARRRSGSEPATCPLCKASMVPEGTHLDEDDPGCDASCLWRRLSSSTEMV